jgi:hypothetical protein
MSIGTVEGLLFCSLLAVKMVGFELIRTEARGFPRVAMDVEIIFPI